MGIGAALRAVAVGLCLVSAPAQAQVPDPFARDLAGQLARAEQFLSERGYGRAAGPFAGGLGSGEQRRFNITLRAGQDYRIVGVCDARCGDLDLKLYDGANALLREDVAPDRVPVIEARPRATGVHAVEVAMYDCAQAPCYFAFTVYAR